MTCSSLSIFHLEVRTYVRHRAQTLQMNLHPVSDKDSDRESERKRERERERNRAEG